MSMDQIRFVPGKMDRYITTKSFELGVTGQRVLDGMEILFDGTNVEMNATRFTLPTLRGAIKLGWLVPADQYDPQAGPTANLSANIGMRPANDLGQNPLAPVKRVAAALVESDERVVMNRGERTQAANQRTIEARSNQGRAGVVRGGPLEVGGSEFGVPVQRSIQTPAKSSLQVTPNSVGAAISQANQVKIQPGIGITEEDLLSQMSDEEREIHQASKEARKADVMTRTVGYVPPPAQTTNLASNNQLGSRRQDAPRTMVASSEPRQVAQIARTQSKTTEGINVSVTTGGGTEIFDASGSEGTAQQTMVSAEGIKFTNTNGPKKAFGVVTQVSLPAQKSVQSSALEPQDDPQSRIERDGTADARRRVAKSLCRDFPDDYDFNDHWKRRLAMIRLNYEVRSDIIMAIFAAESDEFKKLILEEFPDAFSS